MIFAAFVRQLFLCSLLLPLPVFAASLALSIQDDTAKPLPDAVVTLRAIRSNAGSVPGKATIAQIDKEFSPHVTVVPVGSQVWFPNRDRVRHHVYSFSAAKKFDIKLYAGDPPAPVVFDKPGLVVLGCNIHDWMIAYVYVTDAPYFGKSDARGKLLLNDVAPGNYEMSLWHPQQSGSELRKLVQVGEVASPLLMTIPLKPEVP